MAMSYYDEDYYMTGNKSGYGGVYFPYTDIQMLRLEPMAKTTFNWLHPKTTLELGCARGYFTRALRNLGIESYGIDISTWAIEHGDSQVKQFLKQGDITVCLGDYKDREFDLVTAVDVLEHIEKTKLPKTIDHICRIAKRNILVQVPIIDNGRDGSHVSILPDSWWKTQFTMHKFKIFGSQIKKETDGITNFAVIFERKPQ